MEDYIIILNDGGKLSPKMNFILALLDKTSHKCFIATRNGISKRKEIWTENKVELSTSTRGIAVYFLLMTLKSPKDFHDGMIRRISKKNGERTLLTGGLLSSLSGSLQNYFGIPTESNNLIQALKLLRGRKTFLIDEFSGLQIANLNEIKQIGKVIYVSQDVAHNRYDFENTISKKIIYRLEKKAVTQCDLVIACSERDKLIYQDIGAKKVHAYPNIYPTANFKPLDKNEAPSICVVLKEYWGKRTEKSLEEIIKALTFLKTKVTVTFIGKKPAYTPKNINAKYYKLIPSKLAFLELVSKSWICINVGIHLGGTNERKYDFSMAGSVVLSDRLGARGDILPFEYTYVDSHDLAAKINQLLILGRTRLQEMGAENRKQALLLAQDQKESLHISINDLFENHSA